MGWGKYANKNSFDNPLSNLFSSFSYRPIISDNYNFGGSLSYDKWFRGDASLFGGIETRVPFLKGLNFKLEYDPFDYMDFSAANFSADNRGDALYEIRKKDSDINIGLNYSINRNLSIEASYIKGNAFNLSISFGITFDDSLSTKSKFKPEVRKQDNLKENKDVFYENLLSNLNNNRLLLQTSTCMKMVNSIFLYQHQIIEMQ